MRTPQSSLIGVRQVYLGDRPTKVELQSHPRNGSFGSLFNVYFCLIIETSFLNKKYDAELNFSIGHFTYSE